MQRIVMAVIVLAALGIVAAFAASQVPSHQAGAAPPPPQPQPVTITSPVDGQGNVRVSDPPAIRVSLIADNVTLSPNGGTFVTGFIDTTSCSSLAVFTNHSFTSAGADLDNLGVVLRLSVDGTVVSSLFPPQSYSVSSDQGFARYFADAAGFVAPKVAVQFDNPTNGEAIISKAWLLCSQ